RLCRKADRAGGEAGHVERKSQNVGEESEHRSQIADLGACEKLPAPLWPARLAKRQDSATETP
ncbi:MAG: hypothetical protein AAFW68_13035, partial [Pseudomonadota bacterium]